MPTTRRILCWLPARRFRQARRKHFLKDEKQILAATKLPEGVSSLVKGAVAGIAKAVTSATGGGSPKADFFGHLPSHPLSDAYYSQAPIRLRQSRCQARGISKRV